MLQGLEVTKLAMPSVAVDTWAGTPFPPDTLLSSQFFEDGTRIVQRLGLSKHIKVQRCIIIFIIIIIIITTTTTIKKHEISWEILRSTIQKKILSLNHLAV